MARFLIVDDDVPSVNATSRFLRRQGHEAVPFTEGTRALEALAREHFDVVVTDIDMPEVDGLAVVRAARQHAPGACIAVITGNADAEALLQGSGFCAFYPKPIQYAALIANVEACLARGGRRNGVCPMLATVQTPEAV
jgi:DNA-binding NtrC family response regulator